jgi:hypothetical protein
MRISCPFGTGTDTSTGTGFGWQPCTEAIA